MEGLTHAPFIIAAYGITFTLLIGLAIWTWQRGRAVAQQVARLENGSRRRRRGSAQ